MRAVLRIACVVVVVGSPAAAEEVICGKDWISFRPLMPEAFSEKPGLNVYLVRKTHIIRGSRPIYGPLKNVGYVMLTPLKGDARADGSYRVTKETYLAITRCLTGGASGAS